MNIILLYRTPLKGQKVIRIMKNKMIKAVEQSAADPAECIRRIQEAINQHDLDALTACFDPHYKSEFPAHLERAFSGHAQMRANWTQIFGNVPDIHAELIRVIAYDDTVWSEWDWQGTRVDGVRFWQRGVTLQGVQNGQVVWVRMYMEPVQETMSGGAVPPELLGKELGKTTLGKTGV
jgi:hypothetical protein